jgi:hypothetical protein
VRNQRSQFHVHMESYEIDNHAEIQTNKNMYNQILNIYFVHVQVELQVPIRLFTCNEHPIFSRHGYEFPRKT